MERHGIDTVPRVLGGDGAHGYALLSWIEGRDVAEVSTADIDAAIVFLTAVHGLRAAPWAAEQPPAAEACLNGREIERQIQGRFGRLRAAAREEHDNSVALRLAVESKKAHEAVTAAGLAFDAELPQEWRSLVPSDFGFHNSLRRPDGALAFLDFEYFGWDDPVKLTADIVLHPGRPLEQSFSLAEKSPKKRGCSADLLKHGCAPVEACRERRSHRSAASKDAQHA